MGTAVELSGDFDSGNLNSVAIELETNVRKMIFRSFRLPLEEIKM